MKQGTLQKFHDLVTAVEFLHHELWKNLELFRCKVILRDGSNLRILEKYRQDELVYYNSYWLTATNELIIGWDNAPHHLHFNTFPHDKHLAGRKKPVVSKERNLAAVFKFIAGRVK